MRVKDESDAAEIGRSIRRLLFFLVYVTGTLLAIDAAFFAGQYRNAVWQDATHQGQLFNLVDRI